MNARSYKTVFSKRLGALVAVGEHASSQGKANGAGSGGGAGASGTLGYIAALTASFALVSLAWAAPATNALPTAGQVVQGTASMSQAANQLTINQGTQRAAINWQSFDIGAQAKVQVVQPNAQAVLLNRVVGQSPSQIFGQLNANGHVILVNPNGVLFGKDGSVNAASFTASTLGISDANFMAGNMVYERNGSTAGIVNEGTITTAPGGYVALLGASVSNQGQINTQGGNAFLGAADTIKVPVSSTGRIKLELTAADMNANVSNSGSIITQGGQVYMQALALNQAAAQIIQSGSIDTSGVQGGAVHLLADGGQIKVDGSITANSTAAGNKGGDIVIGRDEVTGVLAKSTDVSGSTLTTHKGFVETSGDYLATDGVSVKAAQWLLDPSDITISNSPNTNVTGTSPGDITPTGSTGSSNVLVSTITGAINNGTNVTIKTTNASATGDGNITIASALTFNNTGATDATLSLIADNGITQNAGSTISATGSKLVNISMEAKGNYKGLPAANALSKGITLQAAITTNGDVTLNGTTNNSNPASASNAIGVDIRSTAAIKAKNISITGKSESSFGIQSASVLTAIGDLKLDGTSKNYVGVVTTAAVTAGGALNIIGHKTSAAGYQGININSAVKGATVAITGDTIGHYGVAVGASGSVESTVGDVTIIGTGTGNTSMGAGNQTNGVRLEGAVTAKNKLNITGTVNGAGGYQGVLVYKALTGNSIDIKGTSNAWDAIHFANNGSVTSDTTLLIDGDSSAVGKGILFSGTGVFTAQSYLVKAKTAVNNGIYFGGTTTFNSNSTSLIEATKTTAGSDTIYNAGTLTINSGAGKATLQTSTTNVGGGIRINGGSTVNTTGDVTIGSKNSSNAYTMNQGTINAQGNLKLLGQVNSGSGTMAGVWLQDSGGTAAKIVGTNGANITIDGTNLAGGAGVNLSVNNSANSITTSSPTTGTTTAGNISITGSSASGHGISNAATEVRNTSTNSSTGAKGNITLTGTTQSGSGQGIYNVAAGTNAGLNVIKAAGDLTLIGNSVNSHAVNTSGTLEAGGLLKIEGTAIPTVPLANATSIGIYVGNTVKGGTVSMTGKTDGSKGIEINAAVTSTLGGITLTGTGGGNYYYGQGVVTGANGTLTSELGGITIKGTATASGNNITTIGTQIQGAVTAATDILVEGKNLQTTPNFGLSIENTIKSTGGNVTVKAENTSGTKTALTLNANGKLLTDAANSAININTNGMDLATGAVVQAGTSGTVNIKTTGNNNISIGGLDVPNNSAAGQTLGISNTELGQIKAGNLVIGDTGKTGNITVSGAVSTVSTTGNITLQTGGNIAVDQALTVDNSKTLTLKAGGNITDNDTTGVIKASKLELLGNAAAVTLDSKKHEVGILAADVKSLIFTNGNKELTVGAVKTINSADQTTGTVGIKTKDGVSVTTQTGNLNINEAINNSSSGHVVLGAGVAGLAGELSSASSGDVKTTSGKGITHTNGNLYVYSGSAANSGLVSHLDSALGNLQVTGDASQNVDTNRAFNLAAPITWSTQTAQVMFREKVTITNGLVGTTVENTYGDANTKNTATAALLADAKTKLKAEVGNTGTAGVYDTATSGNIIKIAKSVIIDTLTGNLDGAAYSQSGNGYLKANGTYAYNTASNKLTSTKYNIDNTNFTEGVKVTVAQKALTGSIGDVVKTYGDALSFGTVSALAGKVTGDDVAAIGATVIPTSANTSSSGRLKAGDHTQTLTGLSGADKDNYSYAGVTGSYTVKPKELTIGVGTVKDKPADGTTSAVVTAGTLVGVLPDEKLNISATGNFIDPNMGNGKVVNALYNLQNGVNGEASNYILNIGTPANPDSRLRGNITASVNPVINPTPSPVNNNTGSRVSTVSGFGGSGAATGVLDDKPVTESREVCSDVFPENCECQPSVIPTIEICFAPKRVAATKEEK